ncbi:Ubiquitin carboxyl-terminal hydrolase 5 [Balamuthia mandrillaris]
MEGVAAALDEVRIASGSTRVVKDECVYSFATLENAEDGLYISLNSFLAFSRENALFDHQKTGHTLYLNIKRVLDEEAMKQRQEQEEEEAQQPPKKKPTVLGVGVEGGFDSPSHRPIYKELATLVVLPDFIEIPLPEPSLPDKVQQSIASILSADSATKSEEVASWQMEEEVKVSKYAEDLKQLDNGVRVPPSGWKCQRCDLQENLWLNLTDGQILCGRRQWDGSGGNSHALEHFEETGFPLCVKLATITPQGEADVYSYAENDMVKDPWLAQHLLHFGIDMASMKKTEKTMAELELDLQQSFDWERLQEQGKEVRPIYGPGYTGIQNLGNSCYMSSVLQLLFSVPDFQKRYFDYLQEIYNQPNADPSQDFHVQMAKLADGLLSGKYSIPKEEAKEAATEEEEATKQMQGGPKTNDIEGQQQGIRPRMFKSLVGKGHPEFSTMRQQDALEFYQHLIQMVEQRERAYKGEHKFDPSLAFKFSVEERIECSQSHKVKYTYRDDNVLSLPIPLDKMTNKAEWEAFEEKRKSLKEGEKLPKGEEIVRPKVPLEACLEEATAPELVHGFYSTAINARTDAIKTTKLATFPDVLVLHMRKFVIGDGWVPKKLDVFVEVPDEIDLSPLRGKGLQSGEESLPEDSASSSSVSAPSAAAAPSIDESVVAQLCSMGFPEVRCRKAVINTNNSGAEAATQWLFEHMDDPTIDDPIPDTPKASTAGGAGGGVDEEHVEMLSAMGFTREQALKALKATDNNIERAADWIFSHAHELDSMSLEEDAATTTSSASQSENRPSSTLRDGSSKYRLLGFISHMGSSTMTGHYVCHIKKEGQWIHFNDRKVSISDDPPKSMGYLYFFQRVQE